MKTEVRKRLTSCLLLWAAFVGLKWIMLLSPSSILSKLAPLSVILKDGRDDYNVSGWISIGVETALTGLFFLIRYKKLSLLYIVCMIYSLLYVPAMVYWACTLEFEIWRYLQFIPAAACGGLLAAGFAEYIRQDKLKKPKKKAVREDEANEKTDTEKEENE